MHQNQSEDRDDAGASPCDSSGGQAPAGEGSSKMNSTTGGCEWEVVRYGASSVKVYFEGSGAFRFRWKDGLGAWRSTRMVKGGRQAARAKAKELARDSELARAGRVEVTSEESRVLARLLDLSRGRPWEWLDRADRALRGDGYGDCPEVSLGEAYGQWAAGYEGKPVKTQQTIRERVGRFLRSDGSGRAEGLVLELTREELESWIEWPNGTTFNNRRKEWITFLRWCRRQGYLPATKDVVAEEIERRKEVKELNKVLSLDEGRRIWQAVWRRDSDAVPSLLLAGWMGMRSSEIARVSWVAADWVAGEHGGLRLSSSVVGKTGKARLAPFPSAEIRDILKDYSEGQEETARIGSQKALARIRRLSVERGILKSFPSNGWRHSFCSYRLDQVGLYGKVAKQVGNSEKILRREYEDGLVPDGSGGKWMAIARVLSD